MHYQSKHAAAKRLSMKQRIAGVGIAGAATVVAGIGAASSASAAGSVWDRVAACESGGNWHINTGNGYYGGLQFVAQHVARLRRRAVRLARRPRHQVRSRSPSRSACSRSQGPGAWPVCSVRAGLTRANGGVATASTSSTSGESATTAPKATTKKVTTKKTYAARRRRDDERSRSTTRTSTATGAKITVQRGDTLSKLAEKLRRRRRLEGPARRQPWHHRQCQPDLRRSGHPPPLSLTQAG